MKKNLDLYKPLLLNFDLYGVINLLKAKPSLRNLILEILPEILQKDFDINNGNIDPVIDFMIELIDLKEFEILGKSILIYKDLDEDFYPEYILFSQFSRRKILDEYFKMLPKNHIFEDEVIDIELKNGGTGSDVYYLIYETLKYAINENDKSLRYRIRDIWNTISDPEEEYEFTEEQIKTINNLLNQ